jgi:hypothetical protein
MRKLFTIIALCSVFFTMYAYNPMDALRNSPSYTRSTDFADGAEWGFMNMYDALKGYSPIRVSIRDKDGVITGTSIGYTQITMSMMESDYQEYINIANSLFTGKELSGALAGIDAAWLFKMSGNKERDIPGEY